MKKLTDKKLELFDAMLDDRVEVYGVTNTIQYLLDNNFTKEELLEMKFDEADINKAVEEDKDAAYDEAYDGYYDNPYEYEEKKSEDSDAAGVRYEVRALGYDAKDFCTDLELLLGTYDNKEEAIKKARSFEHLDDVKKVTSDDLELVDGAYVNIVVETIKNNDPTNSNTDTVFIRVLI